jgi:hypothetical protein
MIRASGLVIRRYLDKLTVTGGVFQAENGVDQELQTLAAHLEHVSGHDLIRLVLYT